MAALQRTLLRVRTLQSTSSLPLSSCTCLPTLATSIRFNSSTTSTLTSSSSASSASSSKYTLPKGLILQGLVTKTKKMDQTSTVSIERIKVDHKTLKANALTTSFDTKEFKSHTTYLIHDPLNSCVPGDLVQIRNCKPVSKRKRFEFVKVLKNSRDRESNKIVVEPDFDGVEKGNRVEERRV